MSQPEPIRIGTRASPLARWQADWVAGELNRFGRVTRIVPITTTGDVQPGPLDRIGGSGLFTKELQRALLDDRIDLAVHSLKDLPTEPVVGLVIAAVPPRAASNDVLVSPGALSLPSLPLGARVGTGSNRRKAQLLHARPDLTVLDLRGNVDTRLRKLDEGRYDAIVLAQAGLARLGLASDRIHVLSPTVMLPAVGQGALAIETREADDATRAAVAALDDAASRAAVTAERALLTRLGAGCLAPVGAASTIQSDRLTVAAAVFSLDGRQRLSANVAGPQCDAVRLGGELADALLAQGAGELIRQSRIQAAGMGGDD